jgi:hypothetical protein
MRTLSLTLAMMAAIFLFTLSGCLDQESETGTEGGTTVVTDPTDGPVFDPAQTLCDPFKTNSPQARDRGLIGNLLYLDDTQPRYSQVSDYIDNAHIVEATLYLDRLFTPTRPFDRGFFTESGDLVQTESGNTLYEYFAVRVESQLQLGANEQPGYYQLALLADDGAVMKMPDGAGGQKIIVNNDGFHPTRMGCATEAVYLDHTTKIPITVEYFQGPRYHISLVAMWRPWPDGVSDTNPVNDALCGQLGNDLFFDSTQDPVANQPAFYELLERNWKVLENENYFFPSQSTNPCVPAELPLAISGFSITGVSRNSVTLTWNTNIPATSQGESKNIVTAVVSQTAVDPTLVQSHSLTITGLVPNTLYSVKALSSTPGGQNAESDERAFRTPR